MLGDYATRTKNDLLDKAEEIGEEVIGDIGQSAKDFVQQGQEAVKDAGREAQKFAKQTSKMARDPARTAL